MENENGQRASGHATLGRNVDQAFAFAVFYLALTFVGHGGTASARAQRSNVYFRVNSFDSVRVETFVTYTRHEHRRVQKRESCRLCIFTFLSVTTTFRLTQSIWSVPLSDVVLRCVEATVSLLFLLSVTALWPDPRGIVDVPVQKHLHDFPPVVDSEVFRTFCKTCL